MADKKDGCVGGLLVVKTRERKLVLGGPHTDTGQVMTLSSSMTLTTRKTKYSMNMMKPSSLLMRHLQAAIEMMTKRSMRKRSTMAQKRPLELTCTGFMPLKKDQRSHGNGSLWINKHKEQHTFDVSRQNVKVLWSSFVVVVKFEIMRWKVVQ